MVYGIAIIFLTTNRCTEKTFCCVSQQRSAANSELLLLRRVFDDAALFGKRALDYHATSYRNINQSSIIDEMIVQLCSFSL